MVRTSRKIRKCHVCGKDHTRYNWYNDYDKNGNWTGRYTCYDCHLDTNMKKTKKIKDERTKDIKCCKCQKNETTIKSDGNPDWRRYRGDDNNGMWDGKSYLCIKCYMKIINDLPDSHKNLIKDMRLSREGNLDRSCNHGKDIIGQWIGAKTLGLRDLNIDKNNFREPIDLSGHSLYGNIDVKIATYNHINDQYRFGGIRHNFDNLLALCMDRYNPWKDVEMTFMIPIVHINTNSMTIVKNISSRGSKWEAFMIDIKPFNDTYHSVYIPEFFSPFDLWKGKYDIKIDMINKLDENDKNRS